MNTNEAEIDFHYYKISSIHNKGAWFGGTWDFSHVGTCL